MPVLTLSNAKGKGYPHAIPYGLAPTPTPPDPRQTTGAAAPQPLQETESLAAAAISSESRRPLKVWGRRLLCSLAHKHFLGFTTTIDARRTTARVARANINTAARGPNGHHEAPGAKLRPPDSTFRARFRYRALPPAEPPK